MEDSEQAGPLRDPAAEQEPQPMTLDAFRWPDDLYVPGKGLLPSCLEMNTGRERLYQHATLHGGWPKDAQGRLEFYATVIYCRRTSDNPGATLTAAVRGKKWGRYLWASKADLKDATATIGRSSPPPPEVSAQRKPAAPPRDWSEIDRRIDAMTDDDVLKRLDEANKFIASLARAAIGKGLRPFANTSVRITLRTLLDPTPKTPPPAPIATPGLDLAGLDLGVPAR